MDLALPDDSESSGAGPESLQTRYQACHWHCLAETPGDGSEWAEYLPWLQPNKAVQQGFLVR
jgi:hypothetical protein